MTMVTQLASAVSDDEKFLGLFHGISLESNELCQDSRVRPASA